MNDPNYDAGRYVIFSSFVLLPHLCQVHHNTRSQALHRTHMQTVYFKVECIRLFLDDLMSNDITLVLLLEFHSVPFIVSSGTPAVTVDAGLFAIKLPSSVTG
jgi:hypothetical protein